MIIYRDGKEQNSPIKIFWCLVTKCSIEMITIENH